jgi:phosphoribosylaminoimidazole carboxylase (NCAIR synthetase)
MAIVILHRAALASFPYHDWLRDSSEALYLIVSAAKLAAFNESTSDLPSGAYAQVRVVESYDTSGEVEEIVLGIDAVDPVRAIVAQAEFDMERAARLRACLGLPGQSENSAHVFRNKPAMKACARDAGIAVADWIALTDTPGLLAFVERAGLPIVVKPQNGAGSFNVQVLRRASDLEAFIAKGFTPPLDIRPNMMVESFVTGKTYHIDGLVLDGETRLNWPSVYATASLEFLDNDGEANASYLLHPENPLTARLQRFVQTVLDAFPTPQHCTFHAEVFHTDDDELVLCEIASRTGGARINDTLAACFGVNISEQWARAECGLTPSFSGTCTAPLRLGGWVLVAPRPGVVDRCPASCDLPGLVDFAPNVAVGQTLSSPKAATECIASFVFQADSEASSKQTIAACRRWFYDSIGILQCA